MRAHFIGLTKTFGTLSINLGFVYNLLNMIHKWIERFSNFLFKNPVNPSVPGAFPGFINLIIILTVIYIMFFKELFYIYFVQIVFTF